nr:MAG TPA: hypothetical protein [Caudoviricetes sp.]
MRWCICSWWSFSKGCVIHCYSLFHNSIISNYFHFIKN